MVELFFSSFSYQNTDREPFANRRITCLLSCRQSSETTRSSSSFASGHGCFPRHDAGESEHRPALHSARLSLSHSFSPRAWQRVRFRRHWFAPLLIGTPLVLTAISSLRTAPHQLAYFNEFVGGPGQGYRYLSDSNVDWGQDLRGGKGLYGQGKPTHHLFIILRHGIRLPITAFATNTCQAPGLWNGRRLPTRCRPARPRKILAISASNLQDVWTPDDPLFRWLWMRQPVAKIGYSIFVYDLTHDREGLAKLEETYAKAGIQLPP